MVDKEYAEIFREEAAELLEELESSLLELEQAPDDLKLVGRVFRAMHTIKGSGAMFGFDEIADFTHHVETVLDQVRDGKVLVTNNLIDLILAARDHIGGLLEAAMGSRTVETGRGQEIIADLKALAAGTAAEVSGAAPPAEAPEEVSPGGASLEMTGIEESSAGDQLEAAVFTLASDEQAEAAPEEQEPPSPPNKHPLAHYRIRFRPQASFYANGGDVEPLFTELRKLGECSIFDHTDMETEELAGEATPLFWDILLTTDAGLQAVQDLFLMVEDTSETTINFLMEDHELTEFPEHKRLGEILVERGDIRRDDLQKVLSQQKRLGELLVDAKLVSRSQVESALVEQKTLQQKSAAHSSSSIRVASEKLDILINLVGELVVTQARLSEVSVNLEQPQLMEPVEEIERLTAELRDCVLNVRMLPIGTTFGKFSRLVRDLSAELGKEIDLVTEGAETELDKTVIEKLGDPLVHLIRNCIDHGIESPEERVRIGKPSRGFIRLAAVHSGANVVIRVTDDGKGLNQDKLKAKAIAKGIISGGEELSPKEINNLIFAPGFSMAETVSNVSGRGVGMDVVKSGIEGLKGSVEVASEEGRGTTVTISLPLTLAIIDGLLVRVGQTHFVLPLNAVEECVELSRADVERAHGRHVLPVREKLVPYVRLRDFFEIEGERPELEQVVVVQTEGERVGLVLDDVIGGHQTVIKTLGWVYRKAPGLSGSTILGSGEVALIIDVPQLRQHALREEMAQVGRGGRPLIH